MLKVTASRRLTLLLLLAIPLAAVGFQNQKSPAKSPVRRSSGIRFSDIAVQAKFDFKHLSGSLEKKNLPETFGGGVAWIDYNQDGWPDLYLVNGSRWEELLAGKRTVSNALFRNNRDGTFTNVTRQAR